MSHKTYEMAKKFGELTFWLAVLCALLFSFSGWQVQWLKEAFSSPGQLVFRAAAALVVSILWLTVMHFINRKNGRNQEFAELDLGKYDKRLLVLTLLCRPIFNFCFILSITAETATIALMILLFVKMLTNVAISAIKKDDIGKRKIPTLLELVGYGVVTLGILVYGWDKPGVFDWVLLYAVISGFLEAVRLELIKKLNVSASDRPTFSVFEFVGMLVVALVMLVSFVLTSGGSLFAEGFVGITQHALIAMVTLPLTSVIILGLDYYIAPKMSTGKYSAILATELGFAGVANYLLLGSAFGPFQIAGLVISMMAIMIIKMSSEKKR